MIKPYKGLCVLKHVYVKVDLRNYGSFLCPFVNPNGYTGS